MVYIAITNIIRYNLSMIGELIMKKIIIVFIAVVLFLSGCANSLREDDKKLTLYDVDKEIYLEPLANYQDYFTEAIDYVKSIDNKFNVNDYVLSYSNISSCCAGKLKSCGKLEDGTPLRWMYYKDYLKQQ